MHAECAVCASPLPRAVPCHALPRPVLCCASVAEESKALEALASRRALLQQRQADHERRVRELGTLPADAFEKFKDLGLKVGVCCSRYLIL